MNTLLPMDTRIVPVSFYFINDKTYILIGGLTFKSQFGYFIIFQIMILI